MGYLSGALTGVSIASDHFTAVTARVNDLKTFRFGDGESLARDLASRLEARGFSPNGRNTFGYLLIDGLSMQEEGVVSAIHRGMGDIQLFGGSAGDGTRFESAHIYHEGAFHTDAAVFTLVHTLHKFKVFKTQHFESSSEKMVVTEADPGRRIVTEINGESAGKEYARVVGLDIKKLTPMIFATHPVVVKVGGNYYVRSIQKVNEDGSLTFFCAIDEGIVLTVASGVDLIENLNELFLGISRDIGDPQLVLGCDCILRHLEIKDRGIRETVGDILAKNNVIGFATYGEQFNAMHVNQTFTGVAIAAEEQSV